jgi:hypothetical protein
VTEAAAVSGKAPLTVDMMLLHSEIEAHLHRIAKLLPPAYKLTLLARHTEMPDDKNADIILTRDDPNAVVRAIKRLVP